MSDFLSRLAERTLGLSQVTRPNLLPLFAPSGNPTIESLDQPGGVGETASSPSSATQTEKTSPMTGPANVSEAASSRNPQPVLADASAPEVARETAPFPIVPPRRDGRFRLDEGPEFGTIPPVPRVARAAPEDAQPAKDSPILVSRPLLARTERVGLNAAQNHGRPDSDVPAPIAPPAPGDVAANEPTIRVTIGRVEVRAALPPPRAAPGPSAPEPSLTLEEYVEQRRSGRR